MDIEKAIIVPSGGFAGKNRFGGAPFSKIAKNVRQLGRVALSNLRNGEFCDSRLP
jgi:hypothetical protein